MGGSSRARCGNGREDTVRPIDERFVAAISRRWFRGGPGGTVLVARHEGEPLAAALVVVYRGTAHLRTLPSSRRQKELPATHLLVWDAMRWAKTQGCMASISTATTSPPHQAIPSGV